MFTLAAGLGVAGKLGLGSAPAGHGMWLALVGGLVVAAPTAATGFADWVTLTWGSPPWRTATLHLSAMLTAVALFAVAAWLQYDGYQHGRVTGSGLAAALVGFVALTAGGWLGGTVVFVHGVRVLAEGERAPAAPPPRATPPRVAGPSRGEGSS
jgi:uncharacterized membrane protein